MKTIFLSAFLLLCSIGFAQNQGTFSGLDSKSGDATITFQNIDYQSEKTDRGKVNQYFRLTKSVDQHSNALQSAMQSGKILPEIILKPDGFPKQFILTNAYVQHYNMHFKRSQSATEEIVIRYQSLSVK